MSEQSTLRDRFVQRIYDAQDDLCMALAAEDGSFFREEITERGEGGGGRNRLIEDGGTFEAVISRVSVVHGVLTEGTAAAMRARHGVGERRFFSAGLRFVLHPHSPMVPAAQLDYHYVELGDAAQPAAWWFGGGADLSPAYLFDEDVADWHRAHREACERHDSQLYPRLKSWCDEYYYLPHRRERRGVGGVFFDALRDRQPEQLFAMCSDLIDAFLPGYLPAVRRRRRAEFTPEQKRWQQVRRGRVVEFQLVYDRSAAMGLRSDTRMEDLLMGLPPSARWEHEREPEPGTEEARLVEVLRNPREWI